MKHLFLLLLIPFIAFSQSQEHLTYRSIEGGNGKDSVIAMVSEGHRIYVLGATTSSNLETSENAYQKELSFLQDAFVRVYKLDFDKVELEYSTYFGTEDDDFPTDIAVTSDGSIVISGYTSSSNFPNLNGLNSLNFDGTNGFIVRFSKDLSELEYATRFGGNGNDRILGIDINVNDNIYFCGETSSTNLPTSSSAENKQALGGKDGFFGRLSNNGSSVQELTYAGGLSDDYIKDIVTDVSTVYFLGATKSANVRYYPRGGFGGFRDEPYDQVYANGWDLFIGKFVNQTPEFVTYCGGNNDEIPGNIFIRNDFTTFTAITNSTVSDDLKITSNSLETENSGGFDFLVGQLRPVENIFSKDVHNMEYLSVFGTDRNETLFDSKLNATLDAIIMAGSTETNNYPVTDGPKNISRTDGLSLSVAYNGGKVNVSYLSGGEDNDYAAAIDYVNQSYVTLTNLENSEGITKTFSANNNITDGNDDYLISRFVKSRLEFRSPLSGEEICESGAVQLTVNRIDDNGNQPLRYELLNGIDSTLINTYNVSSGNDYTIDINNEGLDGGDYMVKAALFNGSYTLLEDGFSIISEPIINDATISGDISSKNDELCEGESFTVSVSDNGFVNTYRWRLNGNPINPDGGSTFELSDLTSDDEGILSVIGIGTCSPNSEFNVMTISVTDNVEDIEEISSQIKFENESVTFSANSDGENLEYEWFKDDQILIDQNGKDLILSQLKISDAGSYKVRVYNNCSEATSNSAVLEVNPSGIIPIDQSVSNVYYSGSENTILLSSKEIINSVSIFDMSGLEVFRTKNVNSNSFSIDATNITSGIYFVVFNLNNEFYSAPVNIIR
ncbi:MAG: hypothetical protein Kapaf2KO_14520 [Candidatus Kapaibacteriales bacterium]